MDSTTAPTAVTLECVTTLPCCSLTASLIGFMSDSQVVDVRVCPHRVPRRANADQRANSVSSISLRIPDFLFQRKHVGNWWSRWTTSRPVYDKPGPSAVCVVLPRSVAARTVKNTMWIPSVSWRTMSSSPPGGASVSYWKRYPIK